jgi:hypothetical protein
MANNEVKKIGFWYDYFNWLGGKAHIPLIKKIPRFLVLLFGAFLVVGGASSNADPGRFGTQLLSFVGASIIYYAWQKHTANEKGLDINEIPSNYIALIIVILGYAALCYVLFTIYSSMQ